jgi:hypothetical protein
VKKISLFVAAVLGTAGFAHAETMWGTGFESGEGYVLGSLDGQQGWTTSGTNLPWASVSTANPFDGQQHVRVIEDPGQAAGIDRLAFSPDTLALPTEALVTSVQVAISNDQGANYEVAAQAPSQALVTWRVLFNFDTDGTGGGGPGHIFVLDDPGSGLAFVDTGVVWAEGPYRELKVISDPVADTLDYFYNGAHIYSGVAGLFAGTTVEELVIISDNFQLPGETADFDNFDVRSAIPEPASMGLLAIWGLVVSGRRRVRYNAAA